MPKSSNKAAPIVAKNSNVNSDIGFLTWWEFSNLKVSPSDLRAILNKREYAINVPDIDPRSALLQTVREYRYANEKRFKCEVAYQDDKEIVINVLSKEQLDKKKVEWHMQDAIVWSLDDKSFLSVGTSSDENVKKACAHFVSHFDDRSTFLDHNFVRPNIIQAELEKMNAISLRSRGGVYFVDNSYSSKVEKLNELCSDIQGIALCVCTMKSDDVTKKSLATQVRSSFEERLQELQKRTNEWKDRTRNLRQDTMKSTLEEFASLKNQLEIYQMSLSMKADDLVTDLEDLENIANDLILNQASKDRGVSGSVIKRFEVIMENNGGKDLSEYRIPFQYLENMALPACYFQERFYKASGNSSAYRALIHLGYIAHLNTDKKELELSKI